MPYKLPSPEAAPPVMKRENIPADLWSLIPMAEKYGIGDDFYRDLVVDNLDEYELEELSHCLDSVGDALDSWLCGTESSNKNPSDEYCTMTCLVMAQQMARVELKKRRATTVLAHGSSSVAGAEWFLVGQDGFATVVVRETDHPADQPDRWIAFPFRPGLDWNKAQGKPADPVLVTLCRQAKPVAELNWNDSRKASDLYWAFSEARE